MQIKNKTLTLRPVVLPDDEEFLIELYYTTRADIHLSPLDEVQKRTFSLMQYAAQKKHYAEYFPGTNHDIILLGGERAGRFWTARYDEEIICVDLSILPEYRGSGIGTALLKNLLEETAQTRKVLNLHVIKTNAAAMRLYQRLNFKVVGETETRFKMRWQAEEK